MSKQVDERVVSMQFDNKHFEKNVQQSMSTIDKLKEKLNFTGSAKGLDGLTAAANRVSFSNLSNGIEDIYTKFSSLQVVGVTALANLTNSAIHAGNNIVKSLTIDPIKTGFQEYETQLNSVQTILANTRSKGSTLEDVNNALDELNEYADQTVYNFTEMTRNIGTFTAAGVDLEKSVTSIKGIANLAAISGSTSQQASTAMYQLSQALASGKVSLMDWNSVVNAGMGGEVFQTALKRTATQMGYNVDAIIEKYGSFRESLTQGEWLTAEVLTETLTQLSGAYSEADLIAQGYTEAQAKEITDLAKTAIGAATDVKTFTGVLDTLKESVQSGWAQTWEILFGDYEEAKKLWTGLSNFLGKIVGDSTKRRNDVLGGALLSSPFGELAKKIEKVTAVTEEMTTVTQDFGKVVDDVIGGKFGSGQARIEALTEAGYDWAHIQNLVNESLGNSTRHATDFKEAQGELKKTQAVTIEQLVKMSDAQLKQVGFTQKEIEAFRELEKQSKQTGIPLMELVSDLDQLNGRSLLINSFKNAGKGLVSVFKAMGDAWNEIFPPTTSEQLYNIIAGIHKLSTYLVVSDETADNLRRTLRGLFSIIDIVTTIVGGGFKAAFKVVSHVLGAFDTDILSVTASLGDAAYNFRNFLLENNFIIKGLEKLADGIVIGIKAIGDLIDAFMALPEVQAAIENFKDSISDFKEIGKNMIEGLANGLEDGIEAIPGLLIDLGKKMLEAIKNVLGIHSPSTEMYEVGANTVDGLIKGIQNGISVVLDVLRDLASKIITFMKDVSFGEMIAVGISIGLLSTVKKLIGIMDTLTAPLGGLGDIFGATAELIEKSTKKVKKILNNAAKVVKSFSKVLNSIAFSIKANALKSIAVSIAILAGSVFLLAQLDTAALWSAMAAIAGLATIIAILGNSFTKFDPKDAGNFGLFALAVLAISSSLLIITFAFQKLAKTDPDKIGIIIAGYAVIVVSLIGILKAYGELTKGENAANLDGAGKIFIQIAASMLMMVGVMKLISGMSVSDLVKGAAAILAFVAVIALLTKITSYGKSIDGLGGTLLGMSASLLILVGVVKLIAGLSEEEIKKGGLGLLALVGVMALLSLVTRLGKHVDKLGTTLLAMSTSLLVLVGVVKLLSYISPEDLDRGIEALYRFTGVIALLSLITRLAKSDMPKLGGTLIAMSVSIGILASIAVLLSLINLNGLVKGIAAVGMLSAFMALMIVATRGANDCMKNLIVMSVAIAVFATAVAALSFIKPEKLIPATLALSLLMGMFAVMEKAGATLKASFLSLVTMTLVVGALASIIAKLSSIKMEGAIEKSIALSTLLLAFSYAMEIMDDAKGLSNNAMISAVLMTLVTAALATILYQIKDLPVESTMANAAALSVLLLAFATSMKILGDINGIMSISLKSVALMTAVTAVLAGVLWGIRDLPVESTLSNATALSVLLLALSGSAYILSMIGPLGAASVKGAAGMLLMITGVGAIILAIAGLIGSIPKIQEFLDNGIPVLEKIGYALGSFFGNIVGGFMGGLSSGLPTIGENLSQFIANIIPGINSVSGIGEEAVKGMENLVKMMLMIGGASIVDSIATFLSFGKSPMETFCDNLDMFAEGMKKFSNKISGIDESAVVAASMAGLMLAEMQKTLSVSDIFSFFGGETDLETFGTQLEKFGTAIVNFSKAVSEEGAINPEAIEAAKKAGLIMVELQEAVVPVGGFMQGLKGTQDLGVFGDQLSAFGTALVKFSNAVSVEGAINPEAIEAAKKAGLAMAELQTAVVPVGGVEQALRGTQDLGYFGTQLELYGAAVMAFSKVVSEGTIDTKAIEAAKNAGLIMTELQAAVEPSGGVFSFFTGRDNLGYFGEQIKKFGESIVAFSSTIKEGGGINEKDAEAAAAAGMVMAELQEAIPEDHWFDGKVSLEDFGKDLKKFGAGIKGYSDQVSGLDIASITSSIASARGLVNFAKNIVDFDNSGIENFEAVPTIGKTLYAYSQSISGILYESVTTSIGIVNDLKNLILGLNVVDTMGATAFNQALNTLGKTSIDQFISSFKTPISNLTQIGKTMIDNVISGVNSKKESLKKTATDLSKGLATDMESKKDAFKTAAKTLLDKFVEGIKENTESVKTSLKTIAQNAADAAKEEYGKFKDAGKYLVEGFAAGITENTFKAEAKARAMARAAREAAEDELDEHSPSKVFYGIGAFAGQGFVNALGDYEKKAYNASSDMAGSARSGLSKAIGKISDLINFGMDSTPTIRPVLDLSDVRSGAGEISGMLNLGQSVGVSANVGAITGLMKLNSQNGVNDDIVMAIDKLREGLNNVGGTQYNINGVTYDDGSNIADAVSAIVRAARIERRV